MTTKNLTKVLTRKLGPLTFGGFLRAARTTNDMSQTDMADFLNISKSSLCDIEKGRQHVSIELAVRIAKRCGLSEMMAVEYALQDTVSRAGLKMKVEVKKVA